MLHDSFFNYFSPRPQIKAEFVSPEQVGRLKKFYPLQLSGLGGHKFCPAFDYESEFSEPIKYFTFLRNPIERFLSHINWQINIKGNNSDIEYYLEATYYHNFQCYRLAGDASPFDEVRKLIERKRICLGLVEQYEKSLFMIKENLLPDFKPLKIRMNDLSSSYKKQYKLSELSPAIKDKIRRVNEEDIKLYEYAVQNFPPVSSSPREYASLSVYTNFKRKLSNRIVTLLLDK